MALARTNGSPATVPLPNVQALAEACGRSDEPAPERYIRPDAGAGEVIDDGDAIAAGIPVIDLARLLDPLSSEDERAKLGSACQHPGIFQLINHGVPEEAISELKNDMAEFFKLPLEAKKVYSQLPNSLEGYGQSSYFSEDQKLEWADMFFLNLRPIEMRNMELWPDHPPSFRLCIDRYSTETAKVARSLLELMAKDMGVDPESLPGPFQKHLQGLRMSYYPPCQQAGQVLGISPHTDTSLLTMVLQANDVHGLQVRTDDAQWLPVHAIDGALIVNVGDMLEVMSNGRYKSIVHRVVIHPSKARMSASVIHRLHPDATVAPLAELVAKDVDGKARYRSMSYVDFRKHSFSMYGTGIKPTDGLRV